MKFGIIGAMEVEIELLRNKMENLKTTKFSHLTFFEGKIEGTDCVVVQSGIGKVNAALCAQLLIVKFDVSHIINTGIAGAMAKELKPLDIVISTDCVYHDADATLFGEEPCTIPDMPTFFEADKNLISLAKDSFNKIDKSVKGNSSAYAGRIASGDVFVASKEGKDKINSLCSPYCVEMEGAAIAHTCYLHKVPFVILRCISDSANDSGTSDYSFNKESAAKLSDELVLSILRNFK